jgi:hypothetical protein
MLSEVEWKIVSIINHSVLTLDDIDTVSFNATPNTGLYHQFGLPIKYAYIPLALEPATGFYNYLQRRARDSGSPLAEKKLPYEIVVPEVGKVSFAMRFRLFPPNIFVTTARIRFEDNALERASFDVLFSLRNPRSISRVKDLITWSFDLMNRSGGNFSAATTYYAGFDFSNVNPNYLTDGARQLVGLLIGNRDYIEMDEDIIKSVVGNSAEINKKTTSERLLINKQGVLLTTSSDRRPGVRRTRLRRVMDLAELALVYRSFLDNVYPESRTEQNEDFLDYAFTRIKAWIEQPPAILNVSYTNRLHWGLLISEFGLLEKLRLLENENPWLSQELSGKSKMFTRTIDQWWMRKEFSSVIFKSE